MSKGSNQRPAQVSQDEYRARWEAVFRPVRRCGCSSPCAVCASVDADVCCHGYFDKGPFAAKKRGKHP